MGKTLAAMAAEIRTNNIEKGWRVPEGGPGGNTFGDYIALLHSELSEALEAYRDHRLADATKPGELIHHAEELPGRPYRTERVATGRRPAKPEGVGSEFADVLIRLVDMCDIFGVTLFDMDCEIADVEPSAPLARLKTFGDWITWLHGLVSNMWGAPTLAPSMMRGVVAAAERFSIDLDVEYERKIAYNRTRAFQHGGRTLSEVGRVAS